MYWEWKPYLDKKTNEIYFIDCYARELGYPKTSSTLRV